MSWAEADPKGAMTFAKAEGFEIDSGVGRFVAVRFVSQLSPGAEDAYRNSLRTHPQYNQLLVDVIRFRFSDKLDDGLHYLQKHAQGNWQPIFFDQFGLLLPFDTNVEPYARALSSLPLDRFDPKRLNIFAYDVLQTYNRLGQTTEGMTWSLQLPPATAATLRMEAAKSLNITTADRRTALMKWFQTAPLPEAERATLIASLNARLKK